MAPSGLGDYNVCMDRGTSYDYIVTALVVVVICLTWPSGAAQPADPDPISDVNREIQFHPADEDLYLKRGELYRLRHEWKNALKDYDRANQLDPGQEVVDFLKGQLYFDSGNFSVARKHLDVYLGKYPNHVNALITRARVESKLGDHKTAVQDFTAAIQHDPEPKPEYYLERADALLLLERSGEAIKSIDEGIERLGPVVTLQLRGIDLNIQRKEYDAALQRLSAIAAQSPRKELWLTERGDILRQARRIDEARQAYMAAMQALQSLPVYLRNTKATKALENRIHAALDVIQAGGKNQPSELKRKP